MKQTEKHLALEGLGNQGKVIIYSPTIKTITLAGACKLEAENFSEKYISVELLGASQCILHGQENIEKVSIQGNGAVYFEALSTVIKEANVQLIGASRAKIRVKDKISADLNGASQLFYKGNPSINKHIIGGSKVQKLD